jgi:putative spermidine/putrescine transport system substrate-binding protein
MAAAALAAGGSVSNFEPGKELLMAAKKAGARVYPTNEAFAQALKSEEIGVGVMWKARAVQWQNAGIPVESVAPSEGVPLYISGFSIAKNAPNKDAAYAYINAMLEKPAQEAFAVDMGYNPTVTNAAVAPDLQKRIGFTEDEQKRLLDLDYGYIAKNDQALKEWWDKVFKA